MQIMGYIQSAKETPLMLYSDRYDDKGLHPVIDYQVGALRDDFDFGSLLMYSTKGIKDFLQLNILFAINMPRYMLYACLSAHKDI